MYFIDYVKNFDKRNYKLYDIVDVQDNLIYINFTNAIHTNDLIKFDIKTGISPDTIGYGYCTEAEKEDGKDGYLEIEPLIPVQGKESIFNSLKNNEKTYKSIVKVRRIFKFDDYNNIINKITLSNNQKEENHAQ